MANKEKLKEELEGRKRGSLRAKKKRHEVEEESLDVTHKFCLAKEELRKKYNELEQYFKEQKFSLDLIKLAQKSNNFGEVLRFFINELCKLKKWPIGHVYLLEDGSKELERSRASVWFFNKPKKYEPLYKKMALANLKKNYQLTENLAEIKKPIFIKNLEGDSFFLYKKACLKLGIQSVLLVPLRSYNKTVGFLEFFFTDPEQFDKKSRISLQTFILNLEAVLDLQKARETTKETNKKLRRALSTLKHIAYHDYLTGLPNRRFFEMMFKKDIASAKRHKQKIALLSIDIDDFKEINDQFGHNIGDEFLKCIAKRFQSQIRTEDLVARIGGDEFAIVAQIDESHDAEIICEKLIQEIQKPYKIKSHPISASISLGIAIYPESGATFDALCKTADIALYKAKKTGKGCCHR